MGRVVSLSSTITESGKTYTAGVQSAANKVVEYNSIDVKNRLQIGQWYQLAIRDNRIVNATPIADPTK